MNIGDYVDFWKGAGRVRIGHFGYVEKINRKTASVIIFYGLFPGDVLLAFSHDLIPLEHLTVNDPTMRIPTKWGYMTIHEIYMKACLEHKAAVDEMRTHAQPGHVVSPEDFILDPREVLMRHAACQGFDPREVLRFQRDSSPR